MSQKIRISRRWEIDTADLLVTALRFTQHPVKAQRLLDIGANLGTISLSAAASGFEAVAFEPMPYNVELMAASLAQNQFGNRVLLFKVAAGQPVEPPVSLCEVPAEFGPVESQLGNGQLVPLDSHRCKRAVQNVRMSRSVQVVPVRAVDAVLASAGHPGCFAVVKIDTEGFEPMAVRGARRIFRGNPSGGCRPCMVLTEHAEKYASLRRSSGASDTEVYDVLGGLGYHCKVFARYNFSSFGCGGCGVVTEHFCLLPADKDEGCAQLWHKVSSIKPHGAEWKKVMATTRKWTSKQPMSFR
jgi:FkbM family methyltransferase